ncbi:MAG: hypothetical protein Q8S29_11850, partial [Phreatobacter sp.]|nr:hypothetical protein [Phreatobacter sp.]
MDPRRIAIIAGIVSTVLLGVAVAQIVPGEPRRTAEAPAATTPLRTAIRDVTPLAVETPAPSTTRTIQTSQAQPPPPSP